MADQEEKSRQRILHLLLQLKVELEKHITHLWQLADKVDKVHRDCTISNMTASSAKISSAILSIIARLLAPWTAGVSTALTVTGVGLSVGAAATGVGTAIAESVIVSAVEGEVTQLASTGRNILEKIKEVLMNLGCSAVSAQNNYQSMKSAAACECTKAIKGLTSEIQGICHLKAEVSHSGLMTKGLCILDIVANTVLLGMDVYKLVGGPMVLPERGERNLSERLRQQAGELEKLLQELNQLQWKLW